MGPSTVPHHWEKLGEIVLATFVIGLREGLEAALIVGIIAAFLKRNGKSLTPMWWGVALAVTLSALVGVVLQIVESSLPQAAQEGMETVIGTIAVFFVTGMVLWMNTNARGLKGELESAAGEALAGGTARALAVMAFLAVLKEGFETAVFLLATFQASSNVATAATGAVLGVVAAIALGIALYRGGVKINLSKFFKVTGVFLVFVAAGLVVTALRTAHEAGWLNVGQQATVDLGWLAPSGSIRGALFTGVLGIPAQPRLIEVLGWFAYVVPLCAYLYAPAAVRPSPHIARQLKRVGAAVCLLIAVGLLIGVRQPHASAPRSAPITPSGSISLDGSTLTTPSGRVPLTRIGPESHNGVDAQHWRGATSGSATGLPASLDAEALTQLNGGRMPLGIDSAKAPGPYRASWSTGGGVDVYTRDGGILDAAGQSTPAVTLTGGGLTSARTISLTDGAPLPGGGALKAPTWSVTKTHADRVEATWRGLAAHQSNARFWKLVVPALLVLLALVLLLSSRRRRDEAPRPATKKTSHPTGATPASQTKESQHAHH